MANSTEQRAKITNDIMTRLEEMFNKEFHNDIYFTGDNLNTISFEAGEVNGEVVYGSVKFTLHKSNWDLDAEIEKYDAKVEEKELKAKVAAQKKAEKERKIAEQKAKAKAREDQAARERAKIQKSIGDLKAQLKED